MANNNVVTRDVAEKFVEFAKSVDYTTILDKLPEFNLQNKTKYALNTMLVAIGEHICPVESPKTKEDYKSYYALRYHVLREPFNQQKGTEKDDYEPISDHFMAVNEAGEVVGAVKLYEKSPRP